MTDANVIFPYEDPLSHVRKKGEQPVGWDLVDSPAPHGVFRALGFNDVKRHIHSGVRFDRRWSRPDCRPSLERRAVQLISSVSPRGQSVEEEER